MKEKGILRRVVQRDLLQEGAIAIRDTLECGHAVTKRVSNSGNYQDYNPAERRRCVECPL